MYQKHVGMYVLKEIFIIIIKLVKKKSNYQR